MKRLFAVLLSLTMVLGMLAGCAGGKDSSGSGDKADDNSKKVALICAQGGLGDKSFNDMAKKGLDEAKEKLGVEYTLVEPTEVSQGETYLRQFADAGYGLVMTLEYGHAEAVEKVCGDYPNTVFGVFNMVIDKPNVASAPFDMHHSSYLAGLAAAMVAKDGAPIIDGVATRSGDVIGVICGLESPGFRIFTEGFAQGAHAANPDVKVLMDFNGGFTDTQNVKAIAENMIKTQNADVIFQACGLAGLGALQAARINNALAIGVDDNQDALEPGFVLTSVIKRMDTAVYTMIEEFQKGNAKGKSIPMTLENGGTDITDMSEIAKVVTNKENFDKIVAAVEQARKDIIAGKITVIDGSTGAKFEE